MKNNKKKIIIGAIVFLLTTVLFGTLLFKDKSYSADAGNYDFEFRIDPSLSDSQKEILRQKEFPFVAQYIGDSSDYDYSIKIFDENDNLIKVYPSNEYTDRYVLYTLDFNLRPGQKIKTDSRLYYGSFKESLINQDMAYGEFNGFGKKFGIDEQNNVIVIDDSSDVKKIVDTNNEPYYIYSTNETFFYIPEGSGMSLGGLEVNNYIVISMKPITEYDDQEKLYPLNIRKNWIRKIDNYDWFDDGNPLAGVRFRITGIDINENIVDVLTPPTDDNGKITVMLPKNKPDTSYSVVEEVVPDGFINAMPYYGFSDVTVSYDEYFSCFVSNSDNYSDDYVYFVNFSVGNLFIKKILDSQDETKEFNVKVTLSDKTINGTYGDAIFTNGIANIKIKHNKTKKIIGIPEGITYSVEETAQGYEPIIQNSTGTIKRGNVQEVIINNKRATGNISITKNVIGETTDKSFDVKITLSDKNINGTYGDAIFTNGIANIKIKHNETKNITNIPIGTTYKIVETENESYETTYEKNNGTVYQDTTARCVISNKKINIVRLTIAKIDADTGEELDDWEFSSSSNPLIQPFNSDNNQIIYKYFANDKNQSKIYAKNGSLLFDSCYINSFLLSETKAPFGYFKRGMDLAYVIPECLPVMLSSDNFQGTETDYYKLEKIDANNAVLKIKNKKDELVLTKIWEYYPKIGYVQYDKKTEKSEWVISKTDIPKKLGVTAKFEITFDDVPNGKYELIGAKEKTLNVNNNKAIFTIEHDINSVESSFYHSVRVKGIPNNIKFNIDELESYDEKNLINWEYRGMNIYTNTMTNAQKITSSGTPISYNLKKPYVMKFTKKAVNSNDKNKEYEFTVLPLFGYITDAKTRWNVSVLGQSSVANFTKRPDLLYSVWLHGEDAEKVVDREWFAEYINTFWQITAHYTDPEERIISIFEQMEKINAADAGFSQNDYGNSDIINYGDVAVIEQMVETININTNNFFEYEGNQLIAASKRLEPLIKAKGYSNTTDWYKDTAKRIKNTDNNSMKLEIIYEFIDMFNEAKWTVDDFRFLRVMSIEGLNLDYRDLQFNQSIYDEFIAEFDGKITDESGEFNAFYGRTFKLKDGESKELNIKDWFYLSDFPFLVLEKRNADDRFVQDKSVMNHMHFVEDMGDKIFSNVIYKNTFPTFDIYVSKVDISGKEIPGAKMTIFDENNKKVESWTSSNKKHLVKLSSGKYRLEEVVVPNGYQKAESINFEVDLNGSVVSNVQSDNTIVMIDEYKECEFTLVKMDDNGNTIPNYPIKLYDRFGKEVYNSEGQENQQIVRLPMGTYKNDENKSFEVLPNCECVSKDKTVKVDGNKIVILSGKSRPRLYTPNTVDISFKYIFGFILSISTIIIIINYIKKSQNQRI